MKKHLMIIFILALFLLGGCSSLDSEKYQKLDEYIEDIEVEEISNGLVITVETKGGGSFAIGVPDNPECSPLFGREVDQFFCGTETVNALEELEQETDAEEEQTAEEMG